MGLIRLDLLNNCDGPKAIGTHNAPLFPAGEFDLLWLEKYHVSKLFVVGNGGPLMLAFSNVHVFWEFSIFSSALSTAF